MPITNNSLLTDLRMANMISQEIRLFLADSTSLRNTVFMDFVGSINGKGSDTIRVRQAGLDGYAGGSWTTFTGATEADAVSDTALVDTAWDVTVKRRALQYSISDLASMTGTGPGDIDPFRIAESIARSYDGMFASLTAAAFAGFPDVAGVSGAKIDIDTFYIAVQKLQNKSGKSVPGPYVCVLHPKGFNELQDSIRGETGIVAYTPATNETIRLKGDQYKGSFLGVDIYVSSYVTNDGTNNDQAIWAPGALGFATGAPSIVGAAQVMNMDQVAVEFSRDASKAVSTVTGHAYLGISIIDEDRGVMFQSEK